MWICQLRFRRCECALSSLPEWCREDGSSRNRRVQGLTQTPLRTATATLVGSSCSYFHTNLYSPSPTCALLPHAPPSQHPPCGRSTTGALSTCSCARPSWRERGGGKRTALAPSPHSQRNPTTSTTTPPPPILLLQLLTTTTAIQLFLVPPGTKAALLWPQVPSSGSVESNFLFGAHGS